MSGAAWPGRRTFVAAGLAAGAAVALGAAAVRRVGYLSGGGQGEELVSALAGLGWRRGANLAFEVRVARSADEAEAKARELVRAGAEVLVGFYGRMRALASVTKDVPVVGLVADPVGVGMAKSLARPGGNVTGLTLGVEEWPALVIGLMRAFLPKLEAIHLLVSNRFDIDVVGRYFEREARARSLAFERHLLDNLASAAPVIRGIRRPRAECLHVFPFDGDYAPLAALAKAARVATFSPSEDFVETGGLACHYLYHQDPHARLAVQVDKILRGTAPGEIPFELPTHTTIMVNRRTAAAIGVEIPADVLLRANRVID